MMRSSQITVFMIMLVIGILISLPLSAQESIDGVHNIEDMLTKAEQSFDLQKEDAVFLLDSKDVHWHPDGRLSTTIHRIIWINTDYAVDHYGDHRISYDSEHCDFKVTTVRTWMDGKWWVTGETGIVETLPYAVNKAYDYANVREMMLLHNAIELPCILEVKYTIEDKEPFRGGTDGVWTFMRDEPCVMSSFSLAVPEGFEPYVQTPDDIFNLDRNLYKEDGFDIYSITGGTVGAIPSPHFAGIEFQVPHIVWSTWKSWEELGDDIQSRLIPNTKLDSALEKSMDSLIKDAYTDSDKARLIAEFINTKIRHVDYPESFWQDLPRSAERTYTTAYGHNIDRAILAYGMFAKAGLKPNFAYIGKGYGNIDMSVPSLSYFDGIKVWIRGNNLDAFYDPSDGTVANGDAPIYSKAIWIPESQSEPMVKVKSQGEQNDFSVSINLSYDKEKGIFTGSGYLFGNNSFNAFDQLEGMQVETKTYLESVVSGMLEGAEIMDYNPSMFNRSKIVLGFTIELEKPEVDSLGRTKIMIGEPGNGLFDKLSDDISLYHQERKSSVILPGVLHQKIEIKLDLKDIDLIYFSDNRTLSNTAGKFMLSSNKEDDRLTITRELNLDKATYPSDQWSAFRALLLADKHERNQTLLLKLPEKEKDESDDKEVTEQ
jgi:Domain of Unknown Function with PDB structure (DUF3857)/Domain of Unknown Function with PDB structure (DUF3858)